MAIVFYNISLTYIPKVAEIREDPDGCVRPYRLLSGFLFERGVS